MSKTVVIHQPDFLPHLGFFHKFLQADLWVVLDNVQFLSGSKSWHNRDKIKTPQGAQWLSVAVKKCPRSTLINEVDLAQYDNWRKKNLNLLQTNYRKAIFFKEIWPYIEELYSFRTSKLIEFNMKSIKILMSLLNISIDYQLASSLRPCGKKNELLVDIVKKVKGKTYLSGLGAIDYFSSVPFDNANINVKFHELEHPRYTQVHGSFIPSLSAVDILFNCGISKSREIIHAL